ncbi:MAG: AraC family transcriptional regulator [Planctomycetaceae bacterium]|jgi:AraC-like DNA-binding protein/quercetin dioxygenase-like cupin family protein|nr:AraC family transcriptional regulator [Planctomycetaceae bacterium]
MIEANRMTDAILIDSSPERHILDFQALGFHDVQALGRYFYTKAREPLTIHDHGEMMEICYLADGRQFYLVENAEFYLNGGDVLINYPQERHGSGFQREGRGVLYWMILKPPSKRSAFLGMSPNDGKALWNTLLHLPSRHFRAKPEIRKTLDNIFSLWDNKISANCPSIKNDALLILNIRNYLLRFLLDLIEMAKDKNIPRVSDEIRRAIKLMKNNENTFYTIKTLARESHLSESRFKHRFKEEVGIAPADYQIRRKIELACQRLHEEKSILEISYELGFSSSQYFSTVFRRYMGVSPAEHRKVKS